MAQAKYKIGDTLWHVHCGTFSVYSETWPKRGTMRNGVCWERPTLERVTIGNGSGYWPSPQAMDCVSRSYESFKGIMDRHRQGRAMAPKLADAVKWMWPTPRANKLYGKDREDFSLSLHNAVKMWPTPIRRYSRTFKGAQRAPNAKGSEPLTVQVGGQLNPTWVEWLMGWPLGWTDSKPLEMGKYQSWLKQFGSY